MSAATFDIDALLRASLPPDSPLQIPPPSLVDMQGEFVEYVQNVSLTVRFPVLPRYRNPLGHMQGGFIVAALDNTLGPFSYLIAPPSATMALNTQYLRPVTAAETAIACTARLVERTRTCGSDGKVVALCQAVCQILPER